RPFFFVQIPRGLPVAPLVPEICRQRGRASGHSDTQITKVSASTRHALVRDDFELLDIDHSPVGNLERRYHRQRQKGQLQKWFLKRDVQIEGSVSQGFQLVANRLEAFQTHQPAYRKRKFGRNLSIAGNDKPA